MINQTLNYYNNNSAAFTEGTVNVDFSKTQNRFLNYLEPGASILDFGCGSGRDSKCFKDLGYEISATDGSEELCRLATEYSGIKVKKQLFNELEDVSKYDGIWACSSILHCPKNELKDVFYRIVRALKPNGILYTSFKYSNFEGTRNGRYFTDFTEDTFADFLKNVNGLELIEYWITGDVRPGREEEKWLNIICRKTQN